MDKFCFNGLATRLKDNAILATILTLACIFWISKCTSSFWLDETMTYWVVQEGFVDTIYRAIHFQGPGPFYYLIVWLFVQIGGSSEIVLRLPSILSCVLLCFVLFHFASDLFDSQTAFFVVAVYLCLDGTFSYALNARAYALGLLFLVASTYSLYLWTKSHKKRFKVLYIIFSVLVAYTHCIFVGIFLVHIIYLCSLWKCIKNQSALTIYEIIWVYLCISILVSPEAYQVAIIAKKRDIMSFAATPTVPDLIAAWTAWLQPYLILSLLLGVLVARLFVGNIYIEHFNVKTELLVLLLTWYFFPALEAFSFSLASGSSIFVPRYYLWSLPALALLMGKGLSLIKPSRSRNIILNIFCGSFLIYGGINSPFGEDWSSATAYLRLNCHESNIPVVASTGLAESRDTSWLIHPEKKSYLLSPFAAYKLKCEPLLLPAIFDQPRAGDYLKETVFPILANADQFLLVLRVLNLVINSESVLSGSYLTNKMEILGFKQKHAESFGLVKVISFEKIRKPQTRHETPK